MNPQDWYLVALCAQGQAAPAAQFVLVYRLDDSRHRKRGNALSRRLTR